MVLVLVAVIAGAVTLSVSGGGEQRVREEAERLHEVLQLVADDAAFEKTTTAIALTASGYRALTYDAALTRWQPADAAILRPYRLPGDLRLNLVREGRAVTLAEKDSRELLTPTLVFFSSGEMTAFSITLESPTSPGRWQLSGDGIGEIRMTRSEQGA